MIDNKDVQIKCRITKRDKEEILEYCERHNLTVSEFLRIAYIRMMNQKEEV